MPLAIINLTLLVATEEVENFLEDCSEYVSQTALPLPEIRQKLIDYVTARNCDHYTIINPIPKSHQENLIFRMVLWSSGYV